MFKQHSIYSRAISIILVCFMINLTLVNYSFASNNISITDDVNENPEWVPDQLLVKFRADLSREEIGLFIASKDCKILHVVERMSIYKLKLPPSIDVLEGVELFSKDERVVFAEPNYIYSVNEVKNQRIFLGGHWIWLRDIDSSLMSDWMESSWIWEPLLKWRLSLKLHSTARRDESINASDEPIEEDPQVVLSTSNIVEPEIEKKERLNQTSINLNSLDQNPVEPEYMDVFFNPYLPIIPSIPIVPSIPRLPPPSYYIPPPAPVTPLPLLPPPIPKLPLLPPLPPALPLLPPVLPPTLPPPPPTLPPAPIVPPVPVEPPSIDPILAPEDYLNMINAPNLSQGNNNIVIAIIDTGLDLDHPDISPYLWTNTGEIPGNGIDDDGNGYIDDYMGWDFADDDNLAEDTYGHGTHVAGISLTVGGNVEIMAVRAGVGPTLETFDIAEAIIYAVNNGAQVLNLSFGSLESSQVVRDAVQYAVEHGVVVVAAAGNYDTQDLVYPATYEDIISVAALDSYYQKASFSTYGSWVDICAPGVNIYSTYLNGSYTAQSGTSMAAPMVAGLVARLLSVNPDLSIAEVTRIIIQTADPVDGYEGLLGSGIIDAQEAVEVAETELPETQVNTFIEPEPVQNEETVEEQVEDDNETEEAKGDESAAKEEVDKEEFDDEDIKSPDTTEKQEGSNEGSDKEINDYETQEASKSDADEKQESRSFAENKIRRHVFDPKIAEIIKFKRKLAFKEGNDLPPCVNNRPYSREERTDAPGILK